MMPRHPNNTNKIITDDQFIEILRFINKRYSRQIYSAVVERNSVPAKIHSQILMFCGVQQD